MVASGNWIVPSLPDKPFLERPILYFWAVAASLKVFGMSEAAVRLPGPLFGMFGTLTTAAVGWRMIGRRTGLIAGVFYASMILPLSSPIRSRMAANRGGITFPSSLSAAFLGSRTCRCWCKIPSTPRRTAARGDKPPGVFAPSATRRCIGATGHAGHGGRDLRPRRTLRQTRPNPAGSAAVTRRRPGRGDWRPRVPSGRL